MLSRWKKLQLIPKSRLLDVLNITDLDIGDDGTKKPSRKLVMEYFTNHIHSTSNAVSVIFTKRGGYTAMYITYATGEAYFIEFSWYTMKDYNTFEDYFVAILTQLVRKIRVDYRHTHEFAN